MFIRLTLAWKGALMPCVLVNTSKITYITAIIPSDNYPKGGSSLQLSGEDYVVVEEPIDALQSLLAVK